MIHGINCFQECMETIYGEKEFFPRAYTKIFSEQNKVRLISFFFSKSMYDMSRILSASIHALFVGYF